MEELTYDLASGRQNGQRGDFAMILPKLSRLHMVIRLRSRGTVSSVQAPFVQAIEEIGDR